MKIDRLINIIIYLNNCGRVTAGELAQKYDVSIKTIRRDIDTISMAGIPIVSYQGQDGGYEILKNFKIDRSVLTKAESSLIVKLLEGLGKTCPFKELGNLREKFKVINNDENNQSKFFIDFSSWGMNEKFAEKMKVIEVALNDNRVIIFEYHNLQGQFSIRQVEPLKLIFKGSNWYLLAWCIEKTAYRLFKIRRMNELKIGDIFFEKREANIENLNDSWQKPLEEIQLKVSTDFLNKLEDYFDEYTIKDNIVSINWPIDEWLYGFILSLGSQVEVIAPQNLREIIKNKIIVMKNLYK